MPARSAPGVLARLERHALDLRFLFSSNFRVVVDVHVLPYLSSLEAVGAVVLDLGKVFTLHFRGRTGGRRAYR